jgi:hypothetical protein
MREGPGSEVWRMEGRGMRSKSSAVTSENYRTQGGAFGSVS